MQVYVRHGELNSPVDGFWPKCDTDRPKLTLLRRKVWLEAVLG